MDDRDATDDLTPQQRAARIGVQSPNFKPIMGGAGRPAALRAAVAARKIAETEARRAVIENVSIMGPNGYARKLRQRLIELRVQYPTIGPAVLEPPPRAAALTAPLPVPAPCAACEDRETYPYTTDPVRTRVYLWLCTRCATAWDPEPEPPPERAA